MSHRVFPLSYEGFEFSKAVVESIGGVVAVGKEGGHVPVAGAAMGYTVAHAG